MHSLRVHRALLCGAALSGLGISTANASLSIDLRAVTRNGVAVSDPKTVLVAVGDTIVLRVFADITGLDESKPDCLQDLAGSFLSTGGIKGTLALSGSGITAPFTANASSPGQQTDLDGDGDLDIGSNNDINAEGFFAIRSATMTGPRSTLLDGTTVFPPGAEPTPIPHGTEYRIVSTLRMLVTDLGDSTVLNFRRRNSTTLGGYWTEDATEVATDNGNGTTAYTYVDGVGFTNTSNVIGHGVTLVVPEPATLGLAAIAGLGLLARRRARRDGVRRLTGRNAIVTLRCAASAGAAATVFAAAAAVAPQEARAAFTTDLRAISATGSSSVVDAKHVLVGTPGDIIRFELWGLVPGHDADPTNDGIDIFNGSFISPNIGGTGTLRANVTARALDPNFINNGSSTGAVTDLDGDGDLDVGSNNNGDATGFFSGRAITAPNAIIGQALRLGTMSLTITQILASPGGITEANYRVRTGSVAAAWLEDGQFVTPGPGFDYLSGEAVHLTVVPEPASLLLAALMGVQMLSRRRSRS